MAVMLANIQFSPLDSSLRTEEGPAMAHSWVTAQLPLQEALGENAKTTGRILAMRAFRGSRYSWALFKDLWMPSPRCEILHRSSDIPGPRWELYGMGGVFSPSCGKLPGYLRTAFLGLCGRCWIEMQRAIFSSVFQHESTWIKQNH